jgi:hypothetical protein
MQKSYIYKSLSKQMGSFEGMPDGSFDMFNCSRPQRCRHIGRRCKSLSCKISPPINMRNRYIHSLSDSQRKLSTSSNVSCADDGFCNVRHTLGQVVRKRSTVQDELTLSPRNWTFASSMFRFPPFSTRGFEGLLTDSSFRKSALPSSLVRASSACSKEGKSSA